MRSLRATRKAFVFLPASRSLITSSCFEDMPWLSGVAMGQSLPGHGREEVPLVDAGCASIANAQRQPRSTLHSELTRFMVTDIKDRLSLNFLPDFASIQLTCQRKRVCALPCCGGFVVTNQKRL